MSSVATNVSQSNQAGFILAPINLQQHRDRLRYKTLNGYRIAYVDEGPRDGKPIVLLHGMPTSSWLYRNIIPVLTQNKLRVIAPDMLGFGASDKPTDHASYAFELQADRLAALMQSLQIETWTQVVHDLGGPWTWELVDRNPHLLNGLVIMNTTAYRDGFQPPAMMKLAGGPMGSVMAFMMRNGVTGPGQIKSFFKQFTARSENISPEFVEGYWRSMNEGTTQAFLAFAKVFPWWFEQFDRYAAALRRLDIPAATIWGRHDKVLDVNKLPVQFAKDLRIPANRQHTVDAAHFLLEDQPQEVARLLVEFMRIVI